MLRGVFIRDISSLEDRRLHRRKVALRNPTFLYELPLGVRIALDREGSETFSVAERKRVPHSPGLHARNRLDPVDHAPEQGAAFMRIAVLRTHLDTRRDRCSRKSCGHRKYICIAAYQKPGAREEDHEESDLHHCKPMSHPPPVA